MNYSIIPKYQSKKKQAILKPEELVKLKDLLLVARGVVEGFIAGHHKSPFKGFSLEFAEHRKYTEGDDTKHIDWKVYGKTEKHFVKLYEAETNMKVYIAIDASNSMNFKGVTDVSKMQYSIYLAAALLYLINKQQDQAGLLIFNDKVVKMIPPKNGRAHLKQCMDILSEIKPLNSTNISDSLKKLSEKIKRRGLIILLSDLMDNPDKIISSIHALRHAKNEVIVFHVLDNAELTFPYNKAITFNDLETTQKITVDPLILRSEYIKAITDFQNKIKKSLYKINADYVSVNTIMPFEHVLSSYINLRRNKA